MFTSFLRVAVRNLARHRLYTGINVVGLAIGLAGCLLIVGFIANELSFEDCHANKDRIYRVDGVYASGSNSIPIACVSPPLGPALQQECPEIEKMVRFRHMPDVDITIGQQTLAGSDLLVANPALLQVFTFPLLRGDISTVLKDPTSVVISEDLAQRCFGQTDPLGKAVLIQNKFECRVTGIMKNVPRNTQLYCDMIVPYQRLVDLGVDLESWDLMGKDYTYVLLHSNAEPSAVEEKIPAVLSAHMKPEIADRYTLQLQPLKHIYLHPDLSWELNPSGNLTYIYLFSAVAALILLLASINFVNLSTARTAHRTREIGVRKACGAPRSSLVRQFLGESVLVTFLAMLLGVILFEVGRPQLETFLGRELVLGLFSEPLLLGSMVLMIVVVGVLSGSYPAFYLSRFDPVAVLKRGSVSQSSRSRLRKVLVVAQFVIAIGLIFVTVAIFQQVNYVRSKDMKFDANNVVLLDMSDDVRKAVSPEVLKREMVRVDGVAQATVADIVPGRGWLSLGFFKVNENPDEESKIMATYACDYDFIDMLGIELIAGRAFSEEFPTDRTKAIILNEKAVEGFEIENPIGHKIYSGDGALTVIGVVADFHNRSMHDGILPGLLRLREAEMATLAVKLEPGREQAALAGVEAVWNRLLPEYIFESSFLEDEMARQYQAEEKLSVLFTVFSALAICIACLGIFGLVCATTEQRTGEIGVRKVLGASVHSIVRLMTREFAVLILVANVIAWPLAYYIVSRWLETFAYRMSVGWELFVVSGGGALMVGLMTVSIQAVRAALANPVDSLRQD